MITTQTADNALKSYYLDVVSEQLNLNTNPLLARIKQTTADVWGRDVRKLVRFGVNGGIGAGTEEGPLPAAGANHYAQFVSSLKNLYGTIEISDKAIRASQNNEGAFVNLLNDAMDGLVRSSSYNFGRMLFGNGTGKLATVTAAQAGASSLMLTVDSVQALAEGMIVDFYSGSTPVAAGRVIERVERGDKRIVVAGTDATALKDADIYVQGSYGLELTGLGAVFSDSSTLYGVMRGVSSWMRPYRMSTVGELTEAKIQLAMDKVEEFSGGQTNFIVCSWGVRRALAEQLSKYKKLDSIDLEGGYHAIGFNGIPVVADRFCPAGTMYLLNTEDFCLHQLCDWQWLEGEDGKILKQIAGKPVYTATLVKYAELICSRPYGRAKSLTKKGQKKGHFPQKKGIF